VRLIVAVGPGVAAGTAVGLAVAGRIEVMPGVNVLVAVGPEHPKAIKVTSARKLPPRRIWRAAGSGSTAD
jgi:hypothetical protein